MNIADLLGHRVGSVIVLVEDETLILWNGASTFNVFGIANNELTETNIFPCYCYKKDQAIQAAHDWLENNS